VAVQVHDEADENISLPSDSFSAGQIVFLVLISPLILVILILLGLVWLLTLPFAPDKHDMGTNPSDPNTDSANPNGAYFQSKRSNLWLFYRSWWPAQVDAVPRGVVFFSHGFGEHISRVGYKASQLYSNALIMSFNQISLFYGHFNRLRSWQTC
jgi:hypothetical protein